MVLTGRAPSNEENLIESNLVVRNGGADLDRRVPKPHSAQLDASQSRRRDRGLEPAREPRPGELHDRNGDDGIDMAEEAPSVVARNSANRNHDLGITVTEGSWTEAEQRVGANGNPLQCLNILWLAAGRRCGVAAPSWADALRIVVRFGADGIGLSSFSRSGSKDLFRRPRGWKSSIGLPEGSSSRICGRPGR